MNNEGGSEGDIERFDGSSNHSRSADGDSGSNRTRPARRSAKSSDRQPNTEHSLAAEIARSVSGQPVSADTSTFEVTLVGIPELDIRQFVYDHQLDEFDESHRQPVALFDIENTGRRPVRWKPSRTKFIGDDGYTYQRSQFTLDPSALGPGCHTRQVEIEPGRRARVVTLVERLPADVVVAEVVHAFSAGMGSDTERLVFAVD